MQERHKNFNRDFSLDSIRGIAAIGVLIWHYQHFFEIGELELPFKNHLPFLYKFGWTLVDLFFCLSGFIFFKYYQDRISKKEISLRQFFILRISRLYPLILLTLLCAGALNYLLLHSQGKFFIYHNNSLFAFILNLLFLQYGFFVKDFSFNGPAWSIGVEFWIYLVFFWFSRRFFKDIKYYTTLVFIFFLIALYHKIEIGLIIFSFGFERGFASFFLGGATYFLAKKVKSFKINYNLVALFSLTAATICYILINTKISGDKVFLLLLIIYPLIIFCVNISSILRKVLNLSVLHFLGDISYSIYLWHVPIQLAIFCLIFMGGFDLDPASKKFFFLYLFSVIFVSYLSNKFFEKPLQNKIREKFL